MNSQRYGDVGVGTALGASHLATAGFGVWSSQATRPKAASASLLVDGENILEIQAYYQQVLLRGGQS